MKCLFVLLLLSLNPLSAYAKTRPKTTIPIVLNGEEVGFHYAKKKPNWQSQLPALAEAERSLSPISGAATTLDYIGAQGGNSFYRLERFQVGPNGRDDRKGEGLVFAVDLATLKYAPLERWSPGDDMPTVGAKFEDLDGDGRPELCVRMTGRNGTSYFEGRTYYSIRPHLDFKAIFMLNAECGHNHAKILKRSHDRLLIETTNDFAKTSERVESRRNPKTGVFATVTDCGSD